MTNTLILGAGGQIAQWVIKALATDKTVQQTLLLRDAGALKIKPPANAKIVEGVVEDKKLLQQTMAGQDIVYANLSGDNIDRLAQTIVTTMQEGHAKRMQMAQVKRLIFVLSLGIYDEVPGKFGKWNQAIIGQDLIPYARAAEIIENSGLDYTILRPAWLTDENEINYETTTRDEPFKGTVVSRKSVADLVTKIIAQPDLHQMASLGVNKPNTDADKPYFM